MCSLSFAQEKKNELDLLLGAEFIPRATTTSNRNVATAQVGAGIDVRTSLRLPLPISLRGDVRDYYTLETRSFGVPVQRSGQHNAVLSGGFVVRFWRLCQEGNGR
jgi:hypothetical protein